MCLYTLMDCLYSSSENIKDKHFLKQCRACNLDWQEDTLSWSV